MSSPRSPLPAGIKRVYQILGVLLLVGSIAGLGLTAYSLWNLFHAHSAVAPSVDVWSVYVGKIVGLLLLLLLGIWLIQRASVKGDSVETSSPKAAESSSIPHVEIISSGKASKKHWQLCNVLQTAPEARKVWQFDGSKFAVKGEATSYPGEALPMRMVAKNWQSLWQKKLNIAWLPPENVFLRVVHLPKASLDETVSMVEFQLEKLSPLAVAQIVWTIHVLPNAEVGMQTILAVIVSRAAVEEFLGKLEGQGYLPDRLEISFLEQLLTTSITDDGAWVYPEAQGGKGTAVVAWWYGGVLKNLDFILLRGETFNAENLRAQLRQMIWAGELEGWITAPPMWHLVAADTVAADWMPMLREAVETSVNVVAPLSAQAAAALSARRAAASMMKLGLLPLEFTTRYTQQFHDRLWMRGLLGVGMIYVIAVVIYFAALQVLVFNTNKIETQVASISGTYTNAIELKMRYGVLKDRQELKYAALDCLKTLSEVMPATVTLESFNFNDGQRLTLSGEVSSDAVPDVYNFSEAMRKAQVNGQPLFTQGGDQPSTSARGGSVFWNFSLELKRTEALR